MQRYAGPAALHLSDEEMDLIRRTLAPINFGRDAELAQALRERIKQFQLQRQTEGNDNG